MSGRRPPTHEEQMAVARQLQAMRTSAGSSQRRVTDAASRLAVMAQPAIRGTGTGSTAPIMRSRSEAVGYQAPPLSSSSVFYGHKPSTAIQAPNPVNVSVSGDLATSRHDMPSKVGSTTDARTAIQAPNPVNVSVSGGLATSRHAMPSKVESATNAQGLFQGRSATGASLPHKENITSRAFLTEATQTCSDTELYSDGPVYKPGDDDLAGITFKITTNYVLADDEDLMDLDTITREHLPLSARNTNVGASSPNSQGSGVKQADQQNFRGGLASSRWA